MQSNHFIQFCSCFKNFQDKIHDHLRLAESTRSQSRKTCWNRTQTLPAYIYIYPDVGFFHFSPDEVNQTMLNHSREFGWSLSYHALSTFLCPSSKSVRVADVKGTPRLLIAYQRDCVPAIWLGMVRIHLQTSQRVFLTGL